MLATDANSSAARFTTIDVDLTGGSGFEELVAQPVAAVLVRLQAITKELGNTQDESIAIVAIGYPSDPFVAATMEALRGIVSALTKEFAGRRVRINLVLAAPGVDTSAVMDLLEGPLGAFTAGSTIDLDGVRP